MNPSQIAVSAGAVRRVCAASFFGCLLLAFCSSVSLGDLGPAVTGPAGASSAKTVAAKPPAPAQAQTGMKVVRQVLSPSGKLRIQYLRDRDKGLRQIALQDANNPANRTVLAQYKRNAWVVISPDDEWIVLNNRDGAAAGAQLYHRTSGAPLKYEVPPELRGEGAGLQDVVWKSYLGDSPQDQSGDRSRVTIDGIAWEPDAHRVTLSVAPIASKNDTALPEPWTCVYDVTTRQIEQPAEVAEGAEEAPPNESVEAPEEMTGLQDGEAVAPTQGPADLEGEQFPATREQEITVADANELELSDIRYAINEMLARHGANFKDAKVRQTFAEFSWYEPRTDLSLDDIEKEFSDVEKHNISVLRRCRDAKIAAARRPERKVFRGEPVDEPDAERTMRGILQGVSDAFNNGN